VLSFFGRKRLESWLLIYLTFKKAERTYRQVADIRVLKRPNGNPGYSVVEKRVSVLLEVTSAAPGS